MVPLYTELNNIKKKWNEFCIFGAGKIGRGEAYEVLRCADIPVRFYVDNHIPSGSIVRDGIEVRELDYLYKRKERIF